MFNKVDAPRTQIEVALDRALSKLSGQPVDSAEYAKILERVSELHRMKEAEKPDTVSKDTQALIAANLLSIVLIMTYERVNIITTNALGFVRRLR